MHGHAYVTYLGMYDEYHLFTFPDPLKMTCECVCVCVLACILQVLGPPA